MPALPVADPRAWLALAVCADPAYDPEWWWPAASEPGPADADWTATARALQLCTTCPVLRECREDFYATEPRDPGGIRFATLPQQRPAPLRRRRQQQASRQQETAA